MELTFDLKDFAIKTKEALLAPKVLYAKVDKEKNWKVALSYSIAISIVASIFGIIQAVVLFPALKSSLPEQFQGVSNPTIIEVLPAFLLSTIVIVVLSFVWAWFMHNWLKVCKVKGDFWDSYKAYVYSRAPLALLGWLPWVGALAGLYSLYVLAVGVSHFYKISIRKAILLLVPLVVVMLVIQFLLFQVM